LGTTCAHLHQTHEVVKLMRDVLDVVAPHVALVTETNVPHADNITYFGDGADEAQMVYNFALPPLVLHTMQTGDASVLTEWASMLEPPSDTTCFFNFLDSHDGIGVMGAQGILPGEAIEAMCERVKDHGGFVSHKSNSNGSESPYELNITWFSALNREGSDESLDLQVARFLASRSIALVLKGVPGIYLPSLFGHRNDTEAVFRQGSSRSINRSAIEEKRLLQLVWDPERVPSRIANRFVELIELRIDEPAFHPTSPQRTLALDPRLFTVLRTSPDESSRILCIVNVSSEEVAVKVSGADVGGWWESELIDVVSGDPIQVQDDRIHLVFAPYQMRWIKEPGQGGLTA